MTTQRLAGSEAGEPDASGPETTARTRSHRDFQIALLLGLVCLLVYNANLRLIGAGDTYPARYLPFGIWRYHTVLLDSLTTITAQGRADTAYWIVRGRGGHAISLYPIVVPVIVSPLYLPAVAYLQAKGWDQPRLDRVARIMEKLTASLLAATSVVLLYLLLRRRAGPLDAAVLTLAFAFGTTTWVISSQALWQHGLGELLIVAILLVLTGPATSRAVVAAGLLCGLIACNRPPDSILAVAFGLYGIWWARRRVLLLLAAAALPVGLVLIYNLGVAGNFMGAYRLAGDANFFRHDLLSGLAGLLFSPTRGLFIFSPFLLFLPFCLRQVLRDRSTRGLTVAVCIAAVLQVLLYAKADWRQGASWGPRWLTDLLPIFLWMLPPAVGAMRMAGRTVFVLACVVSVGIQIVGAFWYTGTSDTAIFGSTGQNKIQAAWDHQNIPFLAELRHPPAPPDLAVELRGFLDSVVSSDGAVRDFESGKPITLAGWALASSRSPWEVVALIDGRWAASTASFLVRPDVASTLGIASPSGWRIAIPGQDLTAGEHLLAVVVRAQQGSDARLLAERPFRVIATSRIETRVRSSGETAPDSGRGGKDLALSAKLAADVITNRQQALGYWLTSYTSESRFQHPGVELNTFLPSMMIDVLNPVASSVGLDESLRGARHYLSSQIEENGLVRYHGRPDAPTIGTLGCAISPDADDTALVWRIAPGAHPELLPPALAILGKYRTPEGLYRTWLAPRDRFQCIDPGKDPNPADVAIQIHVLLLMAQADTPTARTLCRSLRQQIGEDHIWVYYNATPLVPILRLADLRKAGCPLQLPPSRLRTAVPEQGIWVEAGQLLQRLSGTGGAVPAAAEVTGLLRTLSQDDFSYIRRSPPLLYHNDLTASVPRFYWSEEFGYALWLRLYFENLRLHPV